MSGSLGLLVFLGLMAGSYGASADQHWTTNGTHKGILQRSVPTGAASGLDEASVQGGRDFIGDFKLAYALWALQGEPVQDFVFTWEWRDAILRVATVNGREISSRDLAKYPDLARQFHALKPDSVTLRTVLGFYDAAEHRFGVGEKTLQPDMIDKAGVPNPLHVPGSPAWAEFFRYKEPANNKKVFAEAARVQLTDPKIVAVEWPEEILQLIAREFLRRETAEAAKPATPRPVPADGLNPLERAAAAEKQLNPLELASRGVRTTPENPLEKNVRVEREEQERLASIKREQDARAAALAREQAAEAAAESRREAAEEERRHQYAADMARAEEAADLRAYRRAVAAQARDRRRYDAQSPGANSQSDINQRIRETVGNKSGSGGLQLTAERSENKPRGAAPCPVCQGRRKCVNCEGRGYFENVETHYKKLPPGATAISQDDPGTKQTVRRTCSACEGSGKCHACGGTGTER